MTLLDDFRRFVTDAEAGAQYAKWAHDNPGDLARWHVVRDAILAGGRPPLPAMLTPRGRELIDAAREHLDATAPAALRVVVAGRAADGQTLTARIVAA